VISFVSKGFPYKDQIEQLKSQHAYTILIDSRLMTLSAWLCRSFDKYVEAKKLKLMRKLTMLRVGNIYNNYNSALLYVFPTRNIVNFLINFTFLVSTYLSKERCSLFVLKVPLNVLCMCVGVSHRSSAVSV